MTDLKIKMPLITGAGKELGNHCIGKEGVNVILVSRAI
jgi:short-subunit dehydrogenase